MSTAVLVFIKAQGYTSNYLIFKEKKIIVGYKITEREEGRMNSPTKKSNEKCPDLVRRTGGGWLAIAPKGARFAIAVTAPTSEEAQEKFCFEFHRWVEILKSERT